jgi:uncharacterized protein (DUF302 family)
MIILGIVIAFVAGLVCGGLVFMYAMRKYMIVDFKIEGGFDNVNEAIEKAIPQFEGWTLPLPSWEFYRSQLAKNLTYDNIKNMVMHFVCKPSHANRILRVNPNFGGIMPCTWAVYETMDGRVHIAKMNIGLMSRMFSGTIKEVMTDVAKTEEAMLEEVRQILKRNNKPTIPGSSTLPSEKTVPAEKNVAI